MTDNPLRFSASWTVEEYRVISYIVHDANNFAYGLGVLRVGARQTSGDAPDDEGRSAKDRCWRRQAA
jgi:hypothetical protein